MVKRKALAVATGLAMAAALCATFACGGNPAGASATITEPAFTGTLGVGGSVSVPFNVTKTGVVTLNVTQFGPDTNPFGVGIGQLASSNGVVTCVTEATQTVTVNDPVSFGGIVAGTYCAVIYDIGYVTQNDTFSMTITHS